MSLINKRPALARAMFGRLGALVAAPLALLLSAGYLSVQELLKLAAPLLTSQGSNTRGQDVSPLPTQRLTALDGSTLGDSGAACWRCQPICE